MNWLEKLIYAIEVHSPEEIRECFAHGVNPNDHFRDEPLIHELISEYTRSPRFKDCVKAFLDSGWVSTDPVLTFVLLDDATGLDQFLQKDSSVVYKKYSFRCAYTPLHQVTLLHICAEFNLTACAEVLVKHGLDINAAAGIDENGFGGQTALFHTVNQNSNQSADMLHFLLAQKADTRITVPGIIWGKGYEWETFIPAVNPISYAMMGLLPQMHRNEAIISKTVSLLLQQGYGIDYTPQNIPNAYLNQ
jgi:hypothetical protein